MQSHILQDSFILETPGGGGYGSRDTKQPSFTRTASRTFLERGSVFEYRKAQESV